MTGAVLDAVLAELSMLDDPNVREANQKRGDDHGVNLTRLREIARRWKTQQEISLDLWATGDTAARLLAALICRPKEFEVDELDTMLCQSRADRLGVLKDYPTPPKCTSPYARAWINEMVSRQQRA
ncbi:DNA alkylation repair protein [Arthrobacter sp. B1I2]|uniref:DNA alkylation repair protein n=1 Tax=Arthrobacter sp. B1I2 TaxID=3042263 RepID=UPI00278A9591|nr:DNA alkylation repair protein [Arthrobacter sp. B1I2]MDQ0730636.1 3-methyladenine DNA glycosylase AlkD [Arthrobacter sp. B1I2]